MKANSREKHLLEKMSSQDFDFNEFKKNHEPLIEDELIPINKVLVMNKVDLVSNRRKFNYLRQELEDIGHFDFVFNISTKTGFGMEELIDYICDQAKRGEWIHHPELNSELNEVQKAQEIMKQLVYSNYFYEVPYRVGIDVTGWTPKTNGELIVDFRLEVPNNSTKGIIIGKEGRIIDDLRKQAVAALSKVYQRPVAVNINVAKDKDLIQSERISN